MKIDLWEFYQIHKIKPHFCWRNTLYIYSFNKKKHSIPSKIRINIIDQLYSKWFPIIKWWVFYVTNIFYLSETIRSYFNPISTRKDMQMERLACSAAAYEIAQFFFLSIGHGCRLLFHEYWKLGKKVVTVLHTDAFLILADMEGEISRGKLYLYIQFVGV